MTWFYDPDHNKRITLKQPRNKFQKVMLDLLRVRNAPWLNSYKMRAYQP